MDSRLQEVISRVQGKYNPVSMFLYGSRARNDFLDDSDYEVGVLYKAGNKVSRLELKELNPYNNIVLYPFEYESILGYKPDTPFPERIYLRDLVESAKTLAGEDVMGKMKPPAIRAIDVLQTLVFHTGMALAAILSYRQGDFITARAEFSKSVLFSTRCLVLVEVGEFPLSYGAIQEKSRALDIADYREVLQHAIEVRKGAEINQSLLFKNLSFQNQLIKPRILEVIEREGANYELFV